jgi:hypothetical protein
MKPTWIWLLRSLFPSWKFFDKVSHEVRLLARVQIENGTWQNWKPVLIPPIDLRASRKLKDLIFNPQGNHELLCQTICEQLLSLTVDKEISSNVVEGSVPFQLVRRIVQHKMISLYAPAKLTAYQFTLCANLENRSTQVLTSSEYRGGFH